jgi:hypothetical protein
VIAAVIQSADLRLPSAAPIEVRSGLAELGNNQIALAYSLHSETCQQNLT